MTTREMRPVILVRQLRFCGFAVVAGGVVGLSTPWLGLTIVGLALALMAALVVAFRHSR